MAHNSKKTPAHRPDFPTLLFIGSREETQDKIVAFLREHLVHPGEKISACRCTGCEAIANQTHFGTTWLTPTHEYVVTDLDPLFSQITYKLEDDEAHFFILLHGERLTRTSGNKLLKVLEEPPAGYYCIIQTNNSAALLPTIKSRAVVMSGTLSEDDMLSLEHEAFIAYLLPFFRAPLITGSSLIEFDKKVREQNLTGEEIGALLGILFARLRKEKIPLSRTCIATYEKILKQRPTAGNIHHALMTLLLSAQR